MCYERFLTRFLPRIKLSLACSPANPSWKSVSGRSPRWWRQSGGFLQECHLKGHRWVMWNSLIVSVALLYLLISVELLLQTISRYLTVTKSFSLLVRPSTSLGLRERREYSHSWNLGEGVTSMRGGCCCAFKMNLWEATTCLAWSVSSKLVRVCCLQVSCGSFACEEYLNVDISNFFFFSKKRV